MFTIALVGRPNVGKSTLFNRLVGKKIALVDDQPGVTRDRREGFFCFGDFYFRIIDTAGYEDQRDGSLSARMQEQTEQAILEADLALFIIDARSGILPLDQIFARFLRKNADKIFLIANKSEGRKGEDTVFVSSRLGFGTALPVSAEHGENVFGLMQDIIQKFPDKMTLFEEGKSKDDKVGLSEDDVQNAAENDLDLEWIDVEGSVRIGVDRPLRITVLGRPNAGKSTLINKILNEERLLTGPEAGITRDSIAVDYEYNGQKITFFDTAGLRKKSNVIEKLEKLSVGDTLRSLQFTEVAIIMMDAKNAFEKQDLQIIELAEREGRAIVLVINKWDEIENAVQATKDLREDCTRFVPFLKGVPMVFLSAKTGRGIQRLFKSVFSIYDQWNGRISTSHLNDWLKAATIAHPPPIANGRRLRLKYMTQIKTRPPTFVLFSSKADKLPGSYKRYLVNSMREEFSFDGTPIRLEMRQPRNPYDKKK